MKYGILILVCSIAGITASCNFLSAPTGITTYGNGPKRILFIGNSLTAANEMPAMVVALAESAKVSPLPTVDVDWAPDFALIDHWTQGNAQSLIRNGHYDLVVLQQGPSSVDVNRDTLRLAVGLFAPIIRASGGIPALFAVWPTSDRLVDFDRATASYQLAANDVRGYLFAGGEVWRSAWRRDSTLQFYYDGLHPNALGSYAVALSIVGMLYDRSVVGLPATIRLLDRSQYTFTAANARLVQESADESNKQVGIKGLP